MSNRPTPRPQRYSRPPSLSTISSNEEADFTDSRRNRQPTQSTYSVSPLLEEYSVHQRYHPHPSVPDQYGFASNHSQARSIPSHPAPYQQEQIPFGGHPDSHLFGTTDEEKGKYIYEPEHPKGAVTRSHFFVVPEMERTNSMFSDDRSSGYAEEAPKKYMKTRYMWMLLQLDQIPWWHNLLAAASAWIVLAAYLVVPGTFTSLSKKQEGFDAKNITNTPEGQLDAFTNQVVRSIDHLGLLIFSGILAGVGSLMCLILFFLHWQNYVWLSWKIFQPMTLNAMAGLLTTIVNVQTAQKGVWSITAKINASVTGFVAAVAGSLFILYNFFLIEGVRKQHRKHFPVDAELVDPIKQRRIGKYMPSQKGY